MDRASVYSEGISDPLSFELPTLLVEGADVNGWPPSCWLVKSSALGFQVYE